MIVCVQVIFGLICVHIRHFRLHTCTDVISPALSLLPASAIVQLRHSAGDVEDGAIVGVELIEEVEAEVEGVPEEDAEVVDNLRLIL